MSAKYPIRSQLGFAAIYSRSGMFHRWRLMAFGNQVATGLEKSNKISRKKVLEAKDVYFNKMMAEGKLGQLDENYGRHGD